MKNTRILCLSAGLVLAGSAVQAADGLTVPAADSLWPQWRARISLQTAEDAPLGLSRLLEGAAPQRGLQGGAVFGDYYFATPSFGGFRASGGLLFGAQSGLPARMALAGTRLGLSVNNGLAVPAAAVTDTPGTLPYLGLGFTGNAWLGGLAVTADLGLVAERPGNALGVGRAIFGSQGFDNAWREMRVTPMVQLGVRYTF
jgi:hypothetical protein